MEIPRHWRLKKQRYALVGEVCPHCDYKIFPPRDICPNCGDEARDLYTFSGKGEVYSYTTVYEAPSGYDANAPYTVALMSAVPVVGAPGRQRRERIRLQGDVPSPLDPPPACPFHTRCWKAQEICRTVEPPLRELKPGHQVACHFPENVDSDVHAH